MTPRRVPPEQRLNRLDFSRRREQLDHAVDIGVYICPHCSNALEFSTSDFERHELKQLTILDAETVASFRKARPVHPETWESSLDFFCEGCQRPVRIVYQADGEWAMGAHGWRIVDLIEVA